MEKEICLKKYLELYLEDMDMETRARQKTKIVMDYQHKLEEEGWVLYPMEGGCVSPDRSTIFYSFREPYVGQLYPWLDNPGKEFQALVKQMIASGDFVYASLS